MKNYRIVKSTHPVSKGVTYYPQRKHFFGLFWGPLYADSFVDYFISYGKSYSYENANQQIMQHILRHHRSKQIIEYLKPTLK